MAEVTDLFEWGAYARRTDPATAHRAAKSVNATRLEAVVLNVLQSFGERGATSHEVAEVAEMELVTVSPRFKPLESKGFIVRKKHNGEVVTRIGKSGRASVVWVAV